MAYSQLGSCTIDILLGPSPSINFHSYRMSGPDIRRRGGVLPKQRCHHIPALIDDTVDVNIIASPSFNAADAATAVDLNATPVVVMTNNKARIENPNMRSTKESRSHSLFIHNNNITDVPLSSSLAASSYQFHIKLNSAVCYVARNP